MCAHARACVCVCTLINTFAYYIIIIKIYDNVSTYYTCFLYCLPNCCLNIYSMKKQNISQISFSIIH